MLLDAITTSGGLKSIKINKDNATAIHSGNTVTPTTDASNTFDKSYEQTDLSQFIPTCNCFVKQNTPGYYCMTVRLVSKHDNTNENHQWRHEKTVTSIDMDYRFDDVLFMMTSFEKLQQTILEAEVGPSYLRLDIN